MKTISSQPKRMDQRLRFCMITTFYPPYNFGGDGIFVHRLSNELAQRGHRVDVIHCIDTYRFLAHKEPEEKVENHPNVTVHGLKSGFGFLSPLATQQTGRPFFKSAAIQQVLDKGFDVINYHNISSVGGPRILEYGQGIKLYTMHEYWLVCPTHNLFKFKRSPCTRKHCLLCGLTYKRPPQWWRYTDLMRSAVKHVDAFICPDYFTKEKHKEMGLDLPIVHLPHFVSSTPTRSSISSQRDAVQKADPFDFIKDKPYFLFVGRLEKLKGLQTLISVFHHYDKARLLIAGIGNYESRLKRLAGVGTNIRFLGYQSGLRLQSLYRHAAAVITPSINYEVAPPLVIMEAFRLRTPAIVRRLGSMPEIIEESGGGLIYETDEDLVAAMDCLVANPSYRDKLGESGYAALEEKWKPEAYLDQYFAIIRKIAATRTMKP